MGSVWYHVVVVFGVGDGGRLVPVLERPAVDQEEAVRVSQAMAHRYAGAVAFSRWMDIANGRYGPPVVRGCYGDLPKEIIHLCRTAHSTSSAGRRMRSAEIPRRGVSTIRPGRLRLVKPAGAGPAG